MKKEIKHTFTTDDRVITTIEIDNNYLPKGNIGTVVLTSLDVLIKFDNWEEGHCGYIEKYTPDMGYTKSNHNHYFVKEECIKLYKMSKPTNPEELILYNMIQESKKLSGL